MQLRVRRLFALLVVVGCTTVGRVHAQAPEANPSPSAAEAAGAKSSGQGVAVLALPGARDAAFALARAVYGSSLRPRKLDEVRARILGGDPAPAGAAKEVRELAELRASVTGDDAASRRLLASIARDLNVRALLVVAGKSPPRTGAPASSDAGAPSDAAVPGASSAEPDSNSNEADAGASNAGTQPSARLFLADTEEFDAARYEPDQTGGWRPTIASISARFPLDMRPQEATPVPAAPKLPSDVQKSKPFYESPWFWGAIAGAAVIGGLIFFGTQDKDAGPIHLQMNVPR